MMSRRSRLCSLWSRVDSGELHQAPREWQAWLSDSGSLTQKIERTIGQTLSVIVLSDGRQNLNSDESRYFHFRLRRCRVREVLLCANGQPLVMARSIIPKTSAGGINHAPLSLGQRPLGALLFANTQQQSKQMHSREITFLTKGDPLWLSFSKRFKTLPRSLWGRRTLYRLKGHPILVTELFLPSLLSYPTTL
ncbi:chorismate lyase [Polynucleobacter meluiroseus]|uniref:Probable chorismate pyruvate-lyase n=1 Tax=Polynucleobacter meluiroseus TaxID=1938814 RepID=A0A240E2X2_9BURK|nr:chorismate lyase [Polynucleobacter meluiroseus]SNX29274.1 chorismate lyase [Polynucleobacter meluiroseus]